MIDSQVAVQQAIFSELKADTQLMAVIKGVFDVVPDNQQFPYITIGDMTAIDGSTQGVDGMEITLTIHSWDQSESRLRLKQIMGDVVEILHCAELVPSGSPQIHNIINVRFEYSDLFKDPDNRTWHGVQRFRIVTDETA